MLKSLGHWLGMLTLAKSRPLLHTDVAVKELLLEAYGKERQGQQELLYVVPFVAKVLECAAESKVFKPPNPWVMAIMRVLVELHAKPDLQVCVCHSAHWQLGAVLQVRSMGLLSVYLSVCLSSAELEV